jgi:ribosomal protein S26
VFDFKIFFFFTMCKLNLNDRLCGLVVRVPGYTMEMYCVSCEVQTEFIYVMYKKVDRLCGLVVRVPGYTTEMYCVSCEVQTEFIYVM